MTTRRLVSDGEIRRVLRIAQEQGLQVAGLDVGRDYVRLIAPKGESDSLAPYIGPSYRQKAPEKR
jgi:hypothetical protein